MSMTTQPVSSFPAMTGRANPAAVSAISVQACAGAFARARAILPSMTGAPASARARRTVGLLGAAPRTGARRANSAVSLMLVAPSAIETAAETSTMPRSNSGDAFFFRSATLRTADSPVWSAALRSRIDPAWPTRPFPSEVTLRAWSHPLGCMAKSAPVQASTWRGNP